MKAVKVILSVLMFSSISTMCIADANMPYADADMSLQVNGKIGGDIQISSNAVDTNKKTTMSVKKAHEVKSNTMKMPIVVFPNTMTMGNMKKQ